jgi:hypothetical protein
VGKGDVFGGLVELSAIPTDHSVEVATLSGEVDHPVRHACVDQRPVESRKVNVLDSVIRDF